MLFGFADALMAKAYPVALERDEILVRAVIIALERGDDFRAAQPRLDRQDVAAGKLQRAAPFMDLSTRTPAQFEHDDRLDPAAGQVDRRRREIRRDPGR